MVLQNHIVKKFIVELGTSGYQQSYALQRRCTAAIKEKIINSIDTLLTDNFPADETVQINRIEIDLGNVNADKIEEVFAEQLMQAFSLEIKKIVANKTTAAGNTTETPDESILLIQQFFYFLKNGALSWSQFNATFETWQQNILQAIEKQPQFFTEKFSKLLQNSPVVAERLLLQFNSHFIIMVVEAALPFLKNKLEPVEEVINTNTPVAVRHKIRNSFFKKILLLLFKASYKKNDSVFNDETYNILVAEIDDKVILKKINATVNDFLNSIQNYTGIKAAEISMPLTDVRETATPDNTVVDDKKNFPDKEDAHEQAEGFFIQNAGLVLLHPFIHNLFKGTGLMEDESFKDNAASVKAIHLLQYLVNGEVETPEYFLHLNKILCGLPQAVHINRFVKLSMQECDEAQQLLQAAIQHWEVLKNSSPQALQETFLQRTGKLLFSTTENGWILHVEKKGVDVLLEKIPWGYSYIKHPWMQHALRVNWI